MISCSWVHPCVCVPFLVPITNTPSVFLYDKFYISTLFHRVWVQFLSFRLASMYTSSIWLHIMISTLFYTECECNSIAFISLLSFKVCIDVDHLSDLYYITTIIILHTVCECNIVSFISLLSFKVCIDVDHLSDFISWSLHYYCTQIVSALLYPLFLFSFSGLHRCTSSIWLHINIIIYSLHYFGT